MLKKITLYLLITLMSVHTAFAGTYSVRSSNLPSSSSARTSGGNYSISQSARGGINNNRGMYNPRIPNPSAPGGMHKPGMPNPSRQHGAMHSPGNPPPPLPPVRTTNTVYKTVSSTGVTRYYNTSPSRYYNSYNYLPVSTRTTYINNGAGISGSFTEQSVNLYGSASLQTYSTGSNLNPARFLSW